MKRSVPAWPDDWAVLPTIAVSEAANIPADFRDDKERITELEYYIRVFANGSAERQRIASDADDVMTGLGYVRNFSNDDDGAGVRQKVMRYRIYL